MLDRELIFCCFVASGCGTSNGRTISGAIKCNLCCHRSERERGGEGDRNQNGNYKIFPHQRNTLIAFN